MRYVAGILRVALTAVGACLLVVGIAGAAGGGDTATAGGAPELTVEGSITPKVLPPHVQTPIGLDLRGRVENPPGAEEHPAAVRTLRIESADLEVHTKGIPVCAFGIQVQEAAERDCGPALIGTGTAVAQVEFAEEGPTDVKARALVYNGGTRDGKSTLFVRADFSAPISGTLLTKVSITHIPGTRSGTLAVAKFPQIAGGSGSIIRFDLTIRKDVGGQNPISATCEDGKVRVSAEGGFEDGSKASTEIVRPCRA